MMICVTVSLGLYKIFKFSQQRKSQDQTLHWGILPCIFRVRSTAELGEGAGYIAMYQSGQLKQQALNERVKPLIITVMIKARD